MPLDLPHATALITIDAQRDTLAGGPLGALGRADEVAAPLVALTNGFRTAGRQVVHVVRLYTADGSNAEPSRRALVSGATPVLRPGTPGRLLLPELVPGEPELDDELLLAGGVQHLSLYEVVLFKPRWGAFFRTALEKHLGSLGIRTLVFAGCNFPNCPRTSIYEASERDFDVVAVSDAISGLDERGAEELHGIGVRVATTADVLADLREQRSGRTASAASQAAS